MTTRRRFIQSGVSALMGAAATGWRPRHAAYDLVIRGGTLFDGTGTPGVTGDLAIAQGRIAAIAPRIAERGAEEIDARGMAVAPGFIDIHSHGDGNLADDPRAESLIRQGVTSIVVGQDGSSRAGQDSFTALLAGFEAVRPSVNVASMIGLGTIRAAVVGETDRPATPDELSRMASIVEGALAQGACGASSGLEYTPGAFASEDELVSLCRPLAARRLPYATHMRNEDDRLIDAIDESLRVALRAGCPLQISHLKTQGPRNWGKLDVVFAHIDAARQAGLDVAFDRYPYIAYQTGLTNLFPVWSRDGGFDAFLGRLSDSVTGARVREETLAKVALIGGWDNVLIAGVRAPEDRDAEGKRLGTYARAFGAEPYNVAIELLRRSGGNVGMVGFAMSERNLERILAHPLGMVCSDGGSFSIEGPTRRGSPHPRGLGSFARVLARYVRERKVLTLEQAVHKMTALPASRVRLADRGRLAPGLAADVVVFDPARVIDRATFEEPFHYAEGIAAVVVNGTLALRDGQRLGAGTGTALRPTNTP